MGHCATKCTHKKANKNHSIGATGEALDSKFELDFTLISCMVTSMMGSVWYMDSGASFHMNENKEFFSKFEEKDLQMHIEMGDDGRDRATNIDTIIFHRESNSPLTLKDLMYVPVLKKNLVSVATLEDYGYNVIFSKRKVFLHHIAT